MSNNPKECPYFIDIGHQQIICKGIVPESNIHQAFPKVGIEQNHHAEYCCSMYHRCPIAVMINSVYKQFEIQFRPYNREVECLHQDECDSCGWNPVVGKERLRRYGITQEENSMGITVNMRAGGSATARKNTALMRPGNK